MNTEDVFEMGDEVIVVGAEYGIIREVRPNDHYQVEVENRGMHVCHASHLQATGRKGGPNAAQDAALRNLSERYGVAYNPAWFRPQFDLASGWVGGQIGGKDDPKLVVGCDPEGRIHS